MGSCFSKKGCQQKTLLEHKKDERNHDHDIVVAKNVGGEEIDAILVECGRLSRSSSSTGCRRNRSYDFDIDNTENGMTNNGGNVNEARSHRVRSKSRERVGGRRVSRSPRRRSKSPVKNTHTIADPNSNSNSNSKPVKMVSVPPTVPDGETRIAPSPTRKRASYQNQHHDQNQTMSLSRSNSRKGRRSPHRRNPLSKIDSNVVIQQNPKSNNAKLDNEKPIIRDVRSRSSRLSRDLDIEVSTKLSSYTSLLLEDIQNFYQKTNLPPIPASVTKAHAIMEAVVDVNYTTFSDDTTENTKQDPFLETVVVSNGDDLTQPSFCKYVTVETDFGNQKSSHSNSLPGTQQRQLSSCQENQIPVLGEGGRRLSAKKRESEQQSTVRKGQIGTQNPDTVAVSAT